MGNKGCYVINHCHPAKTDFIIFLSLYWASIHQPFLNLSHTVLTSFNNPEKKNAFENTCVLETGEYADNQHFLPFLYAR